MVSEEEANKILSQYALGVCRSVETFEKGEGQTTRLLTTDTGKKIVLRRYDNRTREYVLFEVRLLHFLYEQNYPVPNMLQNNQGEYVSERNGKLYMLLEFVIGEHCKNPNEFFEQDKAEKIVAVIAQLHTVTEGKSADAFGKRAPLDVSYCWKEYHKQKRVTEKESREQWLRKELASIVLPATLPRGICHADTNHSNFLFNNDALVAVLDFDMSFHTHLAYDVANIFYWWVCHPEKGMQEDRATPMLAAYARVRQLNEEELAAVFDALKLITLLGMSWSREEEFEKCYASITALNTIGRDGFRSLLSATHR